MFSGIVYGGVPSPPYSIKLPNGGYQMKKLTTEEFIERAKLKHGDRYCYDITNYVNAITKVRIICPIHGEFNQVANYHLSGRGCNLCSNNTKKTTEQFIDECIKSHGYKYDYSLVVYKGKDDKVRIICPIHGEFNQVAKSHINGHGCNKCSGRFDIGSSTSYDNYIHKLEPYGVECRRSPNDENILEVKCMYCSQWYKPSPCNVTSKVRCIDGKDVGECNLYCSDNCKLSCPTYKQRKYPKGHGKQGTSREVQPQLRKLVFDRDGHKCVRCGKGVDEVQLHCHHLDPVKNNPIESADVDNCITLCKEHHKDAHIDIGCRYQDLRKCK